jgi:hypothetical protein
MLVSREQPAVDPDAELAGWFRLDVAQAAGDHRAKAVRAVLRVVRPLKC